MKKFLLLGAAAMMACAANAQTITEVWSATDAQAGLVANGVRQATGFGGKVYLAEVGTGLVTEWENGAATGKSWDVNAWCIEQGLSYETEKDGSTIAVNYSMWAPIAADDNGNLLVNVGGFGDVALATQWAVLATDGSIQLVKVEFPTAVAAGRVDCCPSKVVGDLLSDVYIPLMPNQSTAAYVANVYPDDATGELKSDADFSFVIPTALTGGTQDAIVVNAGYDFFGEDTKAADVAAVTYQRQRGTGSLYGWDAAVEALNVLATAEGTAIGSDGCTATGLAVFTIGETSYYVVPFKNGLAAANHRSASFEVRNLATGGVVAQFNTLATTDNANGSFAAEVNEDGTATIYAFNQADRVGVYTFDPNGTPSGVEETLANDNAPVEYYNLQGVKVANPENGIFVKKQAGKATKVVL